VVLPDDRRLLDILDVSPEVLAVLVENVDLPLERAGPAT